MKPMQILELIDTCVKCGQCLPFCPTYCKTLQESDSPRGRIAQAHGLLTGSLLDTHRLGESLDRCLECHACESVCPSKVPVTTIIDAIRAVRMEKRHFLVRGARRKLLNLAIHPSLIIPYVRFYQRTLLRTWLKKIRLLHYLRVEHADRLLPKSPLKAAKSGTFLAVTKDGYIKGHVALFPGCLGKFIDINALNAAVIILTQLGYTVFIPAQPCCCGALYRHDGFLTAAELELNKTVRLFTGFDRILTVASTCLESLRHAPELVGRVEDATAFIASVSWPDGFLMGESQDTASTTVWIHIPCTQRHPIGDPKSTLRLLTRVPGIVAKNLPENDVCCGAAGTYMLRQPELSQALLADKQRIIAATAAETVVTTNTGCYLQLASQFDPQTVRICHPLEIVAEHLTHIAKDFVTT